MEKNIMEIMQEHNAELIAFYEKELPELRKMCDVVVFDSELYAIYSHMIDDMMNQYIDLLYNALI